MTIRPSLLWILLFFLALPFTSFAQDATDGTLHVLRPIIHSEQDNAELCLEFDHPIDTTDHNHISSNIHLESGGKALPILPQNLSLISTMLCLPSLEHRREYRLTINNLRGANSEKLVEPYRFSFTIPDRQPSLAFLSDLYANGLMRWQDNDPILRAININRVHIELYRIADPTLMTEAWRQRLQTTLAPSESAYFAHSKGQLIWQGDLALEDTANKVIEQKVPLQSFGLNLLPGFYLVVASANQVKSAAANGRLAPLAAAWLLRSDLKVVVFHGKDNYFALTEKTNASSVVRDAKLTLLDRNQQILAEGKSDANGLTTLPLADGKSNNAAILLGFTPSGDVDFVDLTQNDVTHFTLPDIEASLSTDKAFYPAGITANISLSARDALGRPTSLSDSNLLILRPDHSLYANLPISKNSSNDAHISFPVPVGNGLWNLLWQRGDGHKLAETALHITSNQKAPYFEMSADRTMLSEDAAVNVLIKSLGENGKPIPYLTGHLSITWETPDHIFPGWDGYFFGNGPSENSTPVTVASFVTDEKGTDQIHLNLPPPTDAFILHSATLNVQSDLIASAASPPPLHIALKPKDFIVGIKPLALDGKFAENSLAHFDVIALDNEGKRRDVEGLTYQIYEEGRSFDWYQAEGRWDYKPLQQQRRIGGSTLSIKAEGNNVIDWPVTAGSYRLEIANADGTIIARKSFTAGWGLSKTDDPNPGQLLLTAEPFTNHEINVNFKLDRPALVTAVIADDHIQKILHQLKPAGDNRFTIPTDTSWGKNVRIWIDARESNGAGTHAMGQITVPLALGQEKTSETTKNQAAVPATDAAILPIAISGAMPSFLKINDMLILKITLKNNTAISETYHYNLSALPGIKLSGNTSGALALTTGQSHNLFFTLSATQPAMSEIKLDLIGSHNNRLNHSWPITILSSPIKLTDNLEETIASKQNWSLTNNEKADHSSRAKPDPEALFISPQPLFDFPQILSNALEIHAATTRELANQLGILRLSHDVILQTNLLQEPQLLTRQHEILVRLLNRQMPDGGFPTMAGDSEATLISTAAALTALSHTDNPLVKPAEEEAANWLKRRLDNSWFDEKERPERAAAYAALASANKLDMANLHYFSDTSSDKGLPPLAAIQLASAFAINSDSDKANFWINAAHIDKSAGNIDLSLLPYLSENIFFDPTALLPTLEKLSKEIIKKPNTDFETTARFIRTIINLQNRSGSWRFTLNNSEQNLKSIYAQNLPEKAAPLNIQNPTDKSLFITKATITKSIPTVDTGLIRHIYLLNGTEVGSTDMLHHDETYLITAEGPWSEGGNGESLLIYDNPEPALHITSCALGNDLETNESLAWIKGLHLTTSVVCEKAGTGIDAILLHTDTEQKNWRIAYLANAEWSGNFTLAPLMMRNLTHAENSLGQQIQIKIK